MVFQNGYVIYPDKFREPHYRISPFSNADVSYLKERYLKMQFPGNEYLINKFGKYYVFTEDGRSAINRVLSMYNLSIADNIWIVTTTGNYYVSSCVTKEIEKYCSWSREKTPQTKLIFVIHEFGAVYKDMENLKRHGLPIIEDLAMSMFSTDDIGKVGQYGDFAIYSLPKFFPIQFGGVVQCNNSSYWDAMNEDFGENYVDFLSSITEEYLYKQSSVCEKRKINYQYLRERFEALGNDVSISLSDLEVPSVFMFNDMNTDLDRLKVFMQQHGVECSVFYGRKAFFIPVHQNLQLSDLDYMVELYKHFRNEF